MVENWWKYFLTSKYKMPRQMVRRRAGRMLLKRKPYRRRGNMVKRVNRSASGVHYFKRRVLIANIVASTSALGVPSPAAGALTFNLASLPSASEFTALFDQYKITGVKLDFIPLGDTINLPLTSMTGTTGALSPGGPLILATDYDDASTPGSSAQLLEYQASKVIPIPRRHRMYIKPRIAVEINNGITTGYGARTGWVDSSYSSVAHYGVKYWMNAPSVSSASYTYQVWGTYYISCKGVN